MGTPKPLSALSGQALGSHELAICDRLGFTSALGEQPPWQRSRTTRVEVRGDETKHVMDHVKSMASKTWTEDSVRIVATTHADVVLF